MTVIENFIFIILYHLFDILIISGNHMDKRFIIFNKADAELLEVFGKDKCYLLCSIGNLYFIYQMHFIMFDADQFQKSAIFIIYAIKVCHFMRSIEVMLKNLSYLFVFFGFWVDVLLHLENILWIRSEKLLVLNIHCRQFKRLTEAFHIRLHIFFCICKFLNIIRFKDSHFIKRRCHFLKLYIRHINHTLQLNS